MGCSGGKAVGRPPAVAATGRPFFSIAIGSDSPLVKREIIGKTKWESRFSDTRLTHSSVLSRPKLFVSGMVVASGDVPQLQRRISLRST